jgi:hypothetical protein
MPDGHIDRDVQILVHDRGVTVDVRMAASDVTWIEIIGLAAQRTRVQHPQGLGREPFAAAALAGPTQDPTPAFATADDEVVPVDETPLPTKEEEVAAWLVHAPNRVRLEQWLASHCRLQWCATEVTLADNPQSRPDSRHHWSITFQMKFQLPAGQDVGSLKWLQDPFVDYPGKVRRALKTRGESMIDSTDVSPLVVRAEHEIRDEDSTAEQRTERIEATLRLPPPELSTILLHEKTHEPEQRGVAVLMSHVAGH